MVKDARYVIRLAHAGSYTPSYGGELLVKIRERTHSLGGYVMNLRVSRKAIEFDLFCKPDSELPPFLTALQPIGEVLTHRRLDLPPGPVHPEPIVAEARTLFNEERFWEAHEVLEGLWKIVRGAEKQLLQGLILTAAALVHEQKNERKVVQPMLEDAARRLENQPPTYYGLDVQRFLIHLKKVMLDKMIHFPTI